MGWCTGRMTGEADHMSTPDVAQIRVRSSTAARAKRLNMALGVAAAAAAFAILVGTAASDRLLAVFWLFRLGIWLRSAAQPVLLRLRVP